MSAEAQAHVWRHSPYKGLAFAVHLAIGDSANDQYDYEFFMTNATLAAKVRSDRTAVNRALSRMVADGWLAKVHGRPNLHRGVKCYRFIFKVDAPVIYESSRRGRAAHTSPETCALGAQVGVRSEHTEHKTEPKPVTSRSTRSRARRTSVEEPVAADVMRAQIERARSDLRGS